MGRDGASALLGWWHEQDAPDRPPLDALSGDDARAFGAALGAKGLARATVRGYRAGASAITKALRAARTLLPSFDERYNPFEGVQPERSKKGSVTLDARRLAQLPAPARARLELLAALTDLGLSIPEVCTRTWRDLDRDRRFVLGYGGRCVTLGARAVRALETLERFQTGRCPFEKLLRWNADTA